MSLKIVVLAKQVPDTRCVGKDAMNADGTINRAALPAIFNPEDLNALEQALRLKDTHPGSTVTILTMGPGRAAEIIREGLYRGADNGYLLTDRAFAGADTLATSYALATAIRKIGEYDIIVGGRQAIDGDTAQVGPQVAEKLGLPQVTYVEEIQEVKDGRIRVKRHIDGGVETVEGPLPIVITVNGSAAPCRPRNAKLIQKILIDQKIFRNKPNAHSCITQSHFPKRFPAHIRLPDIFHHIKQQCTDEDRDICLIHTNRTSHQNRAE